jgi:hypothetical protein
MSKLSKFIRNLHTKTIDHDIIVTGQPPFRMATFATDQIIGRTIREKGQWEEYAFLNLLNG